MRVIVTSPLTGAFNKPLCLSKNMQQTKEQVSLDPEDSYSKSSSHHTVQPKRSSSALLHSHPSVTNLLEVNNESVSSQQRTTSITHSSFSASELCSSLEIVSTESNCGGRSASLPSSSYFHSLMGASSHKKGCAFCGVPNAPNGAPLLRCQHCDMVAYCGEEHQKFDWKRHKPLCKTVQSQLSRCKGQSARVQFHLFVPSSPPTANITPDSPAKGTTGECASASCSSSPSLSDDSPKCPLQRAHSNSILATVPSASPDCTSHSRVDSRESIQSPHRIVDTSDPDIQIIESTSSMRSQRAARKRPQHPVQTRILIDHSLNVPYKTTLQEHLKAFASSGLAFNQQQAVALRLMTIAEHVIRALNEYGWAQVDNFLGLAHCRHLYQETEKLRQRGLFSAGQLMANKFGSHSHDIRSDEIYWFESGDERAQDAVTIRLLVSMIDSIIVHLNGRVPYKISGRSRAMVAIYPSNGTRYVKHVDNPLRDGRCVTSIYYSNENWNVNQHGGMLRLYPETSAVPVDISPQADRLVLFWSDRRNPHEVMPTFKNRFAVTIWYFDESEKMAALEKKRQEDTKNVIAKRSDHVDRPQTNTGMVPKQRSTEVPEPPAAKFKVEAPSAPSSFSGKLTSHFSANALQGFAENPNAVKTVIAEEQKKIEISEGASSFEENFMFSHSSGAIPSRFHGLLNVLPTINPSYRTMHSNGSLIDYSSGNQESVLRIESGNTSTKSEATI
uniref:hypoxia-inducible factor-proline dioxygenase n=1 Tax=Ascaris suum TaxID=6253 RepID=F1KUB5_ASCSU